MTFASAKHLPYEVIDDDEKNPDTIELIINGGARCIDTIAYYPAALPYDNSAQQKELDLACGIVSRIRNGMIEKTMNPDFAADDCKENRFLPEVVPEDVEDYCPYWYHQRSVTEVSE